MLFQIERVYYGVVLESLLAKVEEYRVVYLDFDSFFASAEQQRRPELRGRPVAVCPFVSDGSCVVAASREAKQSGVRTGMRVFEARRLVPDIILVRDVPVYYRAIYEKTVRILHDTPCRVAVRGIDEMALVLPSYMRTFRDGEELAKDLKRRLNQYLGAFLTVSMGLAATSWQAKMVASAGKPDGFVALGKNQYQSFYAGLKLTDLTGIRHRMARQLYALGIYSPLDLYCASEPFLRGSLGVNGTKWYLRLRGVEVDDRLASPKKSVGHQTTLMPRPAQSFEELQAVVSKMMLKVGYRLRSSRRSACAMSVSVRYLSGDGWSGVCRRMKPKSSHRDLILAAERIMQDLCRDFRPVKKVSIVVFSLVPTRQTSFLDQKTNKGMALSGALDELRRRFGDRAIAPASAFAEEVFPDRIGFGAPEIR